MRMKLTKRQIKKLNKLADDRLKWLRACIKGEEWAVTEYQGCGFCRPFNTLINCSECPACYNSEEGYCWKGELNKSRTALEDAFVSGRPPKTIKKTAKAHYKNLKPLIDRWRRKYVWGK